MKVAAVIPARLTDRDKDLKLAMVNGKTVLEHIVRSLKCVRHITEIVIAAPKDEFSGYFKQLASDLDCRLYLGSNENVGRRIRNALSNYRDGAAVRINAEMPFTIFNRRLVTELIQSHFGSEADFSCYDGMPAGIAADAVSINSLGGIDDNGIPYYRRLRSNPESFRVNNIAADLNLEHLSLYMSKPIDLEIFRKLLKLYGEENFSCGTDYFFAQLHAAIKSLLENESGLDNRKYLNHKLNGLERGLMHERLDSMPVSARIDVHNGCNLRCATCYQRYTKLDKNRFSQMIGSKDLIGRIYFMKEDGYYRISPRPMTVETYEKIAHELFPCLLHCGFGIEGEPLLNENLTRFLEIARRYGVSTNIITNGTLLSESLSERFAGGLLDHISISFDGATKKTFEEIRRGASFHGVLENVEKLRGAKEKLKSNSPSVSLAVTVSRKNIGELPAIVRLASERGIRSIGVRYAFFMNFMDSADALFYHPELVREKFIEAAEAADKCKVALDLPKMAGTSEPEKQVPCHIPWEEAYFYTLGQTKPCCLMKTKGNINNSSLKEIRNSDFQKDLRRSFKPPSKRLENCLNCSMEQYRNVNNEKSFFANEEVYPY